MKTKIEWAELHAPLFLAGTNLGQKLDPTKRHGLAMEYDEVSRHLRVTWNGKTARLPESSVMSMVDAPFITLMVPTEPLPQAGHMFNPNAAQVETPMSHVHAGPGQGQTGQEKPTEMAKRGPGRPKAII